MARIIYGAIASSINGSVGGTTFQRNRYGSTVKNKPTIVDPNWPKQNDNKLRLQQQVTRWRNITNAQRAAWNTWATTYPQPTRLDPTKYLNGFNLFVAWHMQEAMMLPNTIQTNPDFALYSITSFDVAVQNIGSMMKFTTTFIRTSGTWNIMLYSSAAVGASTYLTDNVTRFMEAGPATASPLILNANPQYQNTYGLLAPVGSYVITSIVAVSQTNAQIIASPPLRRLVS